MGKKKWGAEAVGRQLESLNCQTTHVKWECHKEEENNVITELSIKKL